MKACGWRFLGTKTYNKYWQAQVNELSSYGHLYLKMSCQGSVNLCLVYTQFIEFNVGTNLVHRYCVFKIFYCVLNFSEMFYERRLVQDKTNCIDMF